jgi:hypothetical protein
MVGSRLETQTRKTKINATFHSTAVYIVEERLGLLELRSVEEEAKVNTALSCRWIAASRKHSTQGFEAFNEVEIK